MTPACDSQKNLKKFPSKKSLKNSQKFPKKYKKKFQKRGVNRFEPVTICAQWIPRQTRYQLGHSACWQLVKKMSSY